MSFSHSSVSSRAQDARLDLTEPVFDVDLAQRITCAVNVRLPPQLREKVPIFNRWIEELKQSWSEYTDYVDLGQLEGLAPYFSKSLLRSTRAISVDCCPDVPYEFFGLEGVRLPRGPELGGLACADSYFIKASLAAWQPTHFHELIHVIQWKILGPDAYLGLSLLGLTSQGYRVSPLEKMAYSLQDRFSAGRGAFDAVVQVYCELRGLQFR
jgi:hypothetical protein